MIRQILVLVCGVLWMNNGYACRDTPELARKHARQDMVKQREIIKQLASESDAIFVARVREKPNDESASFEILEFLKGLRPTAKIVTYPLSGGITMGCRISDSFYDDGVTEQGTYILYVRAGHIARARDQIRSKHEVSFVDELKIVKKTLR